MRELTIDPTKLGTDESSQELNHLLVLLIEHSKSPFVADGKYTITLSDEEVIVDLKYPLLIRSRNSNKEQKRIEILTPEPFINGGFSSIYKSLGVLVPEEEYKFKEKPLDKTRVCKIIPYSETFDENQINHETSYTKINELLHCKNPVFTDYGGYIVMRYIPGKDLFELLSDVEKKKITLSVEQRLILTDRILKAYKEQIYDKGLIHRDIKPENIIVDLETMTVTFLDFSFALKTNGEGEEVVCALRGSLDFLSPETIMKDVVSIESDLYSLGMTIAQVWGDLSSFILESMDLKRNLLEIIKTVLNKKWIDLFKDIDLSEQMKLDIKTLFNSLTHITPSHRTNINLVLTQWNQLINNFREQSSINSTTEPHEFVESQSYGLVRSMLTQDLNLILEGDDTDNSEEYIPNLTNLSTA